MWNIKQDFIYFWELDKEEQEHEQVLGVNGATSKPKQIGTINIKIKDDLNNVHPLELNEVRHLPDAPLNIFIFILIQQPLLEGDMHVICTILATGIDLDWTDNAGKPTSKYVTHNKSNIGICFTASGYQSFSHFAALFGMPAMYISNDEGEDNMSPQVPL